MTLTTELQTEYVAFWNDTLATKFERYREILMNGLSQQSAVWQNRLNLTLGTRIVDVGRGWGDTALAHKSKPKGHALGLDCVDRFLRKGRNDAAAAGLKKTHFVAEDVQTYPFDGSFDLCFSRFGMVFFENPVVAIRNTQYALKPGGDLVFMVWRPVRKSEGGFAQDRREGFPDTARQGCPALPHSRWLTRCPVSFRSPGSRTFISTRPIAQ